MKKTSLALAVFLMATGISNAQKFMGIATSNWSGTNSLLLNPANIADSRTRFSVDLIAVNFGIDNNLASVNLSSALSSSGGSSNINQMFTFSNKNQFSVMMPYADIHLPGFMVTINHNNSIAVTTRVRAFNQFNNFNKTLFQTVMDPSFTGGNDYVFSSQKFNWTLHMWSEINLSYARVLYEKDKHMVKAGVTLGRTGGIGYVGIKGNNLDVHYYSAKDSTQVNNTDLEFSSSILNSADQISNGFGDVAGQFLGKKGGSGFRADIGAVYEYRPDYMKDGASTDSDPSSNKYRVRASIAITDLGSVKYTNTANANVSGNGSITAGDISSNFLNYSSLQEYMSSRGFHADTGKGTTKVHLPTALLIGADYYVLRHFYTNVTFLANLANRQNFGNAYYNTLTITPRWDTKWVCAAIPISYSALTGGVKAGLGIRLAGLFFGSDDMLAFFSNNQYGLNFYVGGFVPIYKKRHHSASASPDAVPAPSIDATSSGT